MGVETPDKRTGYYVNYVNGDVDVNIPIAVKEDEDGDEVNFGLFGNSYNATFKNLTVENVSVNFSSKQVKPVDSGRKMIADSVGAIVGFGLGGLTMENCTAGSENGNDEIKVFACSGGLVGRCYAGEGLNADNVIDGTVSPYKKIAFKNCKNYVNVQQHTQKGDKIGGFIGYPHRFAELKVENCTNYGDLFGKFAGGFAGYRSGRGDMDSPVIISNFANYGNIVGSEAGGLFGHRDCNKNNGSNASFSITGFANYGNITGDKTFDTTIYAGGICGNFSLYSARAVFSDCFNYGNITVDGGAKNVYAGGLFGSITINKNAAADKKQGCVIIGGMNLGDITVSTTGTLKGLYGCGSVSVVGAGLEEGAVFKQLYFINSGTLKNGTTVLTDKENTNLSIYSTNT